MDNKKLGQDSAFPSFEKNQSEDDVFLDYNSGISKRLYIATKAMQGIITGVRGSGDGINIKEIVQSSFYFADEMLKEEDQE